MNFFIVRKIFKLKTLLLGPKTYQNLELHSLIINKKIMEVSCSNNREKCRYWTIENKRIRSFINMRATLHSILYNFWINYDYSEFLPGVKYFTSAILYSLGPGGLISCRRELLKCSLYWLLLTTPPRKLLQLCQAVSNSVCIKFKVMLLNYWNDNIEIQLL